MNHRLPATLKRLFAWGLCLGFTSPLLAASAAAATTTSQETLVFVRHAEKPDDAHETGQLTCQGQNRALALRSVLLARYGTPDFIFAPQPASNQSDAGVDYYSMRPLATMIPLAVAAARPIRLDFKTKDIDGLQKEVMKSAYSNALIFVAWEHTYMDQLVANLVSQNGGDASQVPAWPSDDFDSIFVVALNHSGSGPAVTFMIEHEGLNGQNAQCEDPYAAREDAVRRGMLPPIIPRP